MADNRQFTDHVEIGGANVYFKEEPTTDTTMANTSYFKTVDADGNPVKISRDNIMGIVKECLGTILNGGSDQTTVTKVPTLNENTLGASTVSTLASVLGVEFATSSTLIQTTSGTGSGTVEHGIYLLRLNGYAGPVSGLLIVDDTNNISDGSLLSDFFTAKVSLSSSGGAHPTITVTSKNSYEYGVYFQHVFNK